VSANPEKVADEKVKCDGCGNFDAQEIADRFLCADCVTLAGSSCAGGGDEN
jgi:hypothetical protein